MSPLITAIFFNWSRVDSQHCELQVYWVVTHYFCRIYSIKYYYKIVGIVPSYTVRPCCSSVSYAAACYSHALSFSSLFSLFFGDHRLSFFPSQWLCLCFVYTSICIIFLDLILHISNIIQYLSLSDISLSRIFSRSIYVAANGSISCFFMAE